MAVTILNVSFLATCGGGGGGGGSSEPNPPPTSQDYIVLAWNDLGMHCLNPTYDQAVILPPYNTLWAQVVKRGNPPEVVTTGLTVEYRILDNTYSYGKVSPGNWNYSQFWDNKVALFGGDPLPHDKGLNLEDPLIQNGLSGTMVPKTDHFQVNGIPVTPVNDSNLTIRNPYQVAEVTVLDASNNVLTRTRATVPTSDEISCNKCHGSNALADVIQKHNERPGGSTVTVTAPILCATCHGSPALGGSDAGSSGLYMSQAMHGYHADKTTPAGAAISCYDCHPGVTAKCNRSLRHTDATGKCVACHGTMSEVASSISSGRVPWVTEKSTCATCHNASGAIAQVNTDPVLYRNAKGHGGLSCAACHGSPHAMVPSSQASDNYQAHQYMGSLPGVEDPETSIGSCGACHENSKPESAGEWVEEHASGRTSACNVCHTGFSDPGNVSKWPHQFQWKRR